MKLIFAVYERWALGLHAAIEREFSNIYICSFSTELCYYYYRSSLIDRTACVSACVVCRHAKFHPNKTTTAK